MAKIPATPLKVDLPSSPKREKAPEAPHEPHNYREGPSTGSMHMEVSPWQVVEQKPNDFLTVQGPGVNKAAYASLSPCMQEHRQKQFFDIFKEVSSKINHRHIPTPPKMSGFHLNPSNSKTQSFTWPKTH